VGEAVVFETTFGLFFVAIWPVVLWCLATERSRQNQARRALVKAWHQKRG
jgi:hypothetical protein